jgi:phage tail-like protein
MPPRTAAQVGIDPYITLHWFVEVEGVVVATFSECSGLSIETEVHEYRAGGQNTYMLKFPGPTKYGNLVLKRGITDNTKLWDWYLQIVQAGQQGQNLRKSITVMLYDYRSESPVRRWQFIRAFPVKWTGPELRADQGAMAIETLEFAHEGLAEA